MLLDKAGDALTKFLERWRRGLVASGRRAEGFAGKGEDVLIDGVAKRLLGWIVMLDQPGRDARRLCDTTDRCCSYALRGKAFECRVSDPGGSCEIGERGGHTIVW